MANVDWLVFIVKMLHVVSAVVLVGGAFFIANVFGPAAGASDAGKSVGPAVIGKWRVPMMITMTLLVITGVVRIMQVFGGDPAPEPGAYHGLLGIKILGALIAFTLASFLVGRSQAFNSMRENPGMWRKLTAYTGLLVVILGVLLSVMH